MGSKMGIVDFITRLNKFEFEFTSETFYGFRVFNCFIKSIPKDGFRIVWSENDVLLFVRFRSLIYLVGQDKTSTTVHILK